MSRSRGWSNSWNLRRLSAIQRCCMPIPIALFNFVAMDGKPNRKVHGERTYFVRATHHRRKIPQIIKLTISGCPVSCLPVCHPPPVLFLLPAASGSLVLLCTDTVTSMSRPKRHLAVRSRIYPHQLLSPMTCPQQAGRHLAIALCRSLVHSSPTKMTRTRPPSCTREKALPEEGVPSRLRAIRSLAEPERLSFSELCTVFGRWRALRRR
ncbi:hypothetical protein BV25DRAFT_703500 [Artomyces pyxidatus]|uniref:Uncharacterized protein n=1 Tax=Artomyces pyxidatus TaxID=48021 RepID=A0ACB8SDQ4_9AGAM|nr:hypothetical protein BV25DRAFT_703500 [Artomyces pyxidatus]